MTTFTINVPAGFEDTVSSRGRAVASATQMARQAGKTGTWQVQEIIEEAGQRKLVMTQTPAFRPNAVRLELGPTFKPSMMEALESHAASQGRTIVEVKEAAGYAIAAALTPAIKTLRRSLAAALKNYPHMLDLNAAWAAEGHLASIEIRRFPQMTGDQARKLLGEWLALVLDGEKAAKGWTIEVSALEQTALLTYGEPRRLPDLVPFSDSEVGQVSPEQWHTIPVGRNAAGEPVEISLKAGPHTLIVGGTGSGKSVTSRAVIAGALARGFEVICIDPTKKMAGQKAFIPYSKGFYTKSVEEASQVLDGVYALVRERVDAIDQADAENWQDLPSGSVRPLMVIIDEWSGLITVDKKPIGDPKQSDEVKEALDEWNAHTAAVGKIQTKVSRLAKEARSAGVHLVIVTQRADATDLPGSVREQMGTIIQLVSPARLPTREALGMVFPSDATAQAFGEIQDLMTAGRRGFGLSYVDGGAVQGFQCSLIEPEEVAPYLDRIGVPLAEKLASTPAAQLAPVDSAPEPAWASAEDPF